VKRLGGALLAAGAQRPGFRRAVTVWCGLWLLGGLLAVAAPPASSPVTKAPEYALKAAYLFNFIQFIEWPSNDLAAGNAPIVIALLGEDPFGGALDQVVKDKTVHGRRFEIKRIKNPGELRDGNVLFVCGSESKRIPEILGALRKRGILTVSDIERFAEQGGMINFFMETNRVRFKINPDAAEGAGIRISSQLLKLGMIVSEKADAKK
jgi:hypothetical protein